MVSACTAGSEVVSQESPSGRQMRKKAKGLVQQLHRLTFTDRVESSGHAQPNRDLDECSSLPVNDLLTVKTFDQPLLGTLAAGLQK